MNFKLSMCYSWTTVLVLNNVGPIIQSERHTIYTCIDLKKCLIQLSLPFRRICTDCLKHRTHGSNIVVWLRKDSSVGYSHQFRFWSQMSILYTGIVYVITRFGNSSYLSDLLYKNITTIDIDNDANEIWSICST